MIHISLGFSMINENALTAEAINSLPSDLEAPSSDQINKTIVLFMMNLPFWLVAAKERNRDKGWSHAYS